MITSILTFAASVALSNAGNFSYTGNDCNEQFDACGNDTECLPLRKAYTDACSEIIYNFTYYEEDFCPAGCRDALWEYLLYVNPSEITINYCDCSNDDCRDGKSNLVEVNCLQNECAAQFELCENNTDCSPYAQAYDGACLSLFNFSGNSVQTSWEYNWCPEACGTALLDYIAQVAPDATTLTFCDCDGDSNCEVVKDLYEDWGCIASDCSEQFQDCEEDSECQTIGETYFSACNDIINDTWSEPWCPSACEDALAAYIAEVAPNATSLSFCDCNDEETCYRVKDDFYNLGCINNDCNQGWTECNADEECAPTAQRYFEACEVVINGSWTNDWCPSDCSYWLAAYMDAVAPNATALDFCDCNGNDDCESGKSNLESKGCIATDCTKLFYECEQDEECGPLAAAYLSGCASILDGSYDGRYCPSECEDAIQAYVAAVTDGVVRYDYCDCNGNTECLTFALTFLDLGCVNTDCSEQYYECTLNDTCNVVAEEYFDSCQSILNGSYNGTECPPACEVALNNYIQTVSGRTEIASFTDVCYCNSDEGCLEITQQYDDLGCVTLVTPSTTEGADDAASGTGTTEEGGEEGPTEDVGSRWEKSLGVVAAALFAMFVTV